jgi:hypothetical protein
MPGWTDEPADDVTAPPARQATGAGVERLPKKIRTQRFDARAPFAL